MGSCFGERFCIPGVRAKWPGDLCCGQNVRNPSTHDPPAAIAEQRIYFPAGLTQAEVLRGWVGLFDGWTLTGWRSAGEVNWRIENGAIVADRGEVALLRSTSQFSNFVLRLEFRGDRNTNSGVFIRTSPQPRSPELDCYEINIAPPSNPFPTGSLVGRQRAEKETVTDPLEWQAMEIAAVDRQLVVRINGDVVLEYEDENWLGRGYIGLQHNSGRIEFRNISLLPVFSEPANLDPLAVEPALGPGESAQPTEDAEAAFNSDLQRNWKPVAGDAVVSVGPGGWVLQGGRGQLESRKEYADFMAQLVARTGNPDVNSGLFFRCIPGEMMNGYESQIDHRFEQNAGVARRDRPADHGTGGVFRRAAARYVNADPEQWFAQTLVVTGPHVSVWVNGLQVVDWSDTRNEHANPRRGKRLAAGTLAIQGHDPGTELEVFRFDAIELRDRWEPPKQRNDR